MPRIATAGALAPGFPIIELLSLLYMGTYQFDGDFLVGLHVLPAVEHAERALTDVLAELELLADA